MAFTPTITGKRPYFEAKLRAGSASLPAWAAWTGTGSRVTQVGTSATAAQCGAAIKSLLDDLIARGVIN
jgi:hypothetical protein